MVNYQEGKIYKLVCNTTGLQYIGSTTKQRLSQRLATHVSNYNKYLNGKYHYVSSYRTLENKNYEMVLLETYPCNSKVELFARERFYIDNNECVNIAKPILTPEERLERKDKQRRSSKESYQENKEELLRKIDCYCGVIYSFGNRNQHFHSLNHRNCPCPPL